MKRGGGNKQRVLRVEGELGQEKLETTDGISFDEIGLRKGSECLAVVAGLEDGDNWPRSCGGRLERMEESGVDDENR